jgi:hypothetical protein
MGKAKVSEKIGNSGIPQASSGISYKNEYCKRRIDRLTHCGVRYAAKDSFARAEASLERALLLAQKHYGIAHVRTARITLSLAKVCAKSGKESEAALLSESAERMLTSSESAAPFGGSAGFYSLLAF